MSLFLGICFLLYTILCHTLLCSALLCSTLLHSTPLHSTLLCYAMLCYAMLCCAILCCAVLCYTMMFYYTNDSLLHCAFIYYSTMNSNDMFECLITFKLPKLAALAFCNLAVERIDSIIQYTLPKNNFNTS